MGSNAGGVAYTWDARGNLVNDGVFTYTYNAAGRLVQAENVSTTLAYTYTAAGLRVEQSVGGSVTTYTWDTALPLAQVLATSDGALDLYGVGRIGEERGNAWAYPLGDALGSVRQWADASADVTYAASYRPFGEVLEESGSTESAWGFTGEWWDEDAEKLYLRARWYDVGTGRFGRRDVLPGHQGTPASLHPYAYTWNSPVNWSDPAGLCPVGQRQACYLKAREIEMAFGVDLDMWFNPILDTTHPRVDVVTALGRFPGCEANLWEWWELRDLYRLLSDFKWFTGYGNFNLHIPGHVGIRRVHTGLVPGNPHASQTKYPDPRGEFPGETIEYTTDLFRPNGAQASYAHLLRNAMHELMHAYSYNHDRLVQGEYETHGTDVYYAFYGAGWQFLDGDPSIFLPGVPTSERKKQHKFRNIVLASLDPAANSHLIGSPTVFPTDYAESGIHEDFADTATMFAAHWLCAHGNGDACTVRGMMEMEGSLNPTTKDLTHIANTGRVRWMEDFFDRDFPYGLYP